MTVKTAPHPTTEPEPRRSAPHAPDPVALVRGLERLREGLSQRLVRIEDLALEQARLLEQDATEREQALRERVAVLETSLARVQAEMNRREQESQSLLRQLEADRKLLADSWERLEDEQLAAPAGVAPPPVTPPAAERSPPSVPPAPAGADDPADGAVTRAILREFQSLQTDVRRNTRGPRNGR